MRKLFSSTGTLDKAVSLEAKARALVDADKFDQAVTAAEQALSIAHALLQADDPARVDYLRTLAYALFMADREPEGLPYLGEAVRILDLADGPPDPRLVGDLHVIATQLRHSAQPDSSWPYLARFIELSRQLDGGQHDGYCDAVRTLSQALAAGSAFAAAAQLLDDNMPTVAALIEEASPAFCGLLGTHAFVLEAGGRYLDGRAVAERQVTLSRQVFGEHSLDHIDSLGRLASLRRALHDFAGARDLARAQAALYEQTADVGTERIASALWEIAENDFALGDFQNADAGYRRAIALFRSLPDGGENLPRALNGLAALRAATGHIGEAAEALRETHALYAAMYGERSLLCGQVMSDLAALHLKGDDPARAEPLMQEALVVLRDAAGDGHPAYARALHDLGVIQRTLGQTALARATYTEALQRLQAAVGDEHLLVANHLQGLGDLNREDGKLGEAQTQLERAVAMMQRTLQPGHPRLRTARRSLSALYVATACFDLATALMMQEMDGELDMICQLFALSSEHQRTTLLAGGSALDPLLTLVTRHGADDPVIVRQAFEQLLRRKGLGIEALSAQRDALYGGKHPQLAAALNTLHELRERIARHALAGPGPEGGETHIRWLAEWDAERQEQEIALSREIPELALAEQLRRADLGAVAAALPAGAALVEFVQFVPQLPGHPGPDPARMAAFVLVTGGDGQLQLVDLGEAEPINVLVAELLRSVTGGLATRGVAMEEEEGVLDVDRIGDALRRAVFDPLLAAIGTVRRLYLSPDGALHRLPFEVLPLTEGRRVIDDYAVSYLGTGRDALRFGVARSGAATAPVVIADPDFDLSADVAPVGGDRAPIDGRSRDVQRAGLWFTRLPGTRVEGEQVTAMIGATGYFGAAAVERALKGCRSPQILHIATHGFFLPDRAEHDTTRPTARLGGRIENPMLRSGLALAGANSWLENAPLPEDAADALLNGEDVSALDLMATQLVVLSACESGLGDVQAGEGVFGLRRAFVLAGAATLVVSLWKVPDAQTQELMSDFYQRLLAGTPRAEALRAAQRALRARHPNVRDWGAFICIGESGVLA